jgi:hypothetical protein
LIDSILLNAETGDLASSHRTGRFNCFAMLLLIGASLREASANLLAEISARPIERTGPLACSASPVRDGALLRLAGEEIESVSHEIKRHLNFLGNLLGDNPWSRKW